MSAKVPDYLIVGRVTKPHGIHGALKVEPITDDPRRFDLLKTVHLGPEDQPQQAFSIQNIQHQQNHVILTLEGLDDRNDAERWRDHYVHIPADDALPLQEGEYYYYQLIGLDVFSTQDELLGKIEDILSYPANDIFVVRREDKEFLIPDIPDVVKHIDLQRGAMIIDPLEGLLE